MAIEKVPTHSRPLAEAIARKTRMVYVADPAVLDLYGYTSPILDEEATMVAFHAAWKAFRNDPAPPIDCDCALELFRHWDEQEVSDLSVGGL